MPEQKPSVEASPTGHLDGQWPKGWPPGAHLRRGRGTRPQKSVELELPDLIDELLLVWMKLGLRLGPALKQSLLLDQADCIAQWW